MGYSENRKKCPLVVNDSLYSDGCGNKYENKYYYNGLYVDLCGMSIEDYMTNPCCNCNGGGSGSDSKLKNKITVKYVKDDNGDILYTAYATYAVTSYIKVKITFSDNTITELDLNAGDKQSNTKKGSEPQFNNYTLNITEDNDYIYSVVMESSKITYKIYNKAILLSDFDKEDFSVNTTIFNSNNIENGNTLDITFSIPSTDEDLSNSEMSEEELREYYKNFEHCFVLCLPKSVYDNKKYSIKTVDGTDITSKFINHKEDSFMINGGEYVLIDERSTDDNIEAYVPNYNEILTYNYKLVLSK